MSESKVFEYPVRVKWEDTDAGGVVYHANYIKFMERARSEALRADGLNQRKLEAEQGIVILVAELSIKYKRAAQLEDLLTVKTRVEKLGRASVVLNQSVWRGDELLTDGRVKVAAVKKAELKPVPLPAEIYDMFKAYVTEPES